MFVHLVYGDIQMTILIPIEAIAIGSLIFPCIVMFIVGWHFGFRSSNKLFDNRYDHLEGKIQDCAESVFNKMDDLRRELGGKR